MANTPVINLEDADLTSTPEHYTKRLEEERIENANADKIDLFMGHLSASFSTVFRISGSVSDRLDHLGIIGAEYTPVDRVIKNVVCWAHTSGSGGVTVVDIQVQGPAGNFVSIFSNLAYKPALSSSYGDFGLASGSVFISGSNMRWAAGKLMRAIVGPVAGATGLDGQKMFTVDVRWVPSGSYGSGA